MWRGTEGRNPGEKGTEFAREAWKERGREMGEMGKNYVPYAIFRNDFEIEKARWGGSLHKWGGARVKGYRMGKFKPLSPRVFNKVFPLCLQSRASELIRRPHSLDNQLKQIRHPSPSVYFYFNSKHSNIKQTWNKVRKSYNNIILIRSSDVTHYYY